MSADAGRPEAHCLEARWWTSAEQDAAKGEAPAVVCTLCPHACVIAEGKRGYCRARGNASGRLLSPYLGRFSSIAIDPVEKKPLYHWRPGSHILSLGSLGCTMRCPFCQNHSIAQPSEPFLSQPPLKAVDAPNLAAQAREQDLAAIAYTYNEPALQAEYIIAAAPVLREAGIATVLVSNGMYSEALLQELAPVVDAANIDLKCFNSKTYARLGGSLESVMRSIQGLLEAGAHVEITTLVVPGISDSPEDFLRETEWLAGLSPDIPLHISRYRPAHKYEAPPTDIALLQSFASLARQRLRHVHIGNVPYLRM